MKKILILSDSLSINGGADKVALQHFNYLSKYSNVRFLTTKNKDIINTNPAISFIYPYKHVFFNFYKNILNLKFNSRLSKVLEMFNPDEVIVHSFTKQISPIIFFRLSNFKTSIVMHDYFLVCPNGGMFNYKTFKQCKLKGGSISCALTNCDKSSYGIKIYRLFRFYLQTLGLRFLMPKIYYFNIFQKKYLTGYPFKQKFSFLNEIFNPYKINKNYLSKNYLVYIGRGDPEKGIMLFNDTSLKIPFKLALFGFYNKKIAFNFKGAKFFGWSTEDKISIFLREKCRVGIFPSIWLEADPLVPWEMMRHNIPVVSFRNNAFGHLLSKTLPELVYANTKELNDILINLTDDSYYKKIVTKIRVFYQIELTKRDIVTSNFYKNLSRV
jgi:glycosyltransferase involved in cell wall biosynthesis